ncbi:hypothetical protein [Stutzerimonas stutzeri]|uniref:hypothetical protein n=1 Tax=Stutzerimonas stutzeri TaxID=316 RepID=UPI000C99A883|nr:hypothetical protein [Stutzerimonas stutzeri]PNG13815.1 hypothetical protein CXK97_11680 [Stutzerimonas stutzeri]
MNVSFILLGEGSSDLRLTEHIEQILIMEGFDEVSGDAPDLSMFVQPVGLTVRSKLEAVIKYYPSVDLIFIHRDADNAGVAAREQEILDACSNLSLTAVVVPLVPVKMLEAWLLADQDKIKMVGGGKNYRGDIEGVPGVAALENVRDAKSMLLNALCEVSGASGGKLRAFKQRFPEMRARLTYDLDPDGPVNRLSSYRRFRQAVTQLAQQLL